MSTTRNELRTSQRNIDDRATSKKADSAANKDEPSKDVSKTNSNPKRKEVPTSNAAASSPSSNEADFHMQKTDLTLNTLPANSILVHSTNCFGLWGAGVALAIHDLCPAADTVYAAHCDSLRPNPDAWPQRDKIVGTCLLIPPQPGDFAASEGGLWIACLFTSYGFGRPTKKKARLDPKGKIVAQTNSALEDFRKQVRKLRRGEFEIESVEGEGKQDMKVLKFKNAGGSKDALEPKRRKKVSDEKDNDEKPETENEKANKGSEETGKLTMDIYSPQFNSGAFGIKWEETTEMVEEIFSGWEGNWFVLSPPK